MLRSGSSLLLGTLLVLMQGTDAEAGSVGRGKVPEWLVFASDDFGAEVVIEIPEVEVEKVDEGGHSFHVVTVLGAGRRMESGRPEVPVMARLVEVPPGAAVDVDLRSCEYAPLTGIRMRPYGETDKGPVIDEGFYGEDRFSPEPVVEVGDPVVLRDCWLVPLIVYPVQYNPVREEARVVRSLRVKLVYGGGHHAGGGSRRGSGRSEAYERLYRSSVLNCGSVPASGEVERGGYLIVTPDQYYEALQPLVEWKREKGHHTHVVVLSEIGSNPREPHIRNSIQDYYSQCPVPLEYVVLIGDFDELPSFSYEDEMEPWGLDASDHPYSMLEGNDYFPEVFVGRLSVSSVSEMRTVVKKIVSYERDPYMEQTDWYKRALMVCNYGGVASARTTKLWVREKLLENGFSQVDTSFLLDYWCDVDFISSVINEGVSFVNYRGWMDWGGWTSVWYPTSNVGNIRRLQNGFMLPVVTDMVCNATDFWEHCAAEAWLRVGSVTNPRGAVAVVGPTAMNTFVYFNNVLDGGFYAGVFDDSLFTVGQALVRAKMELYMQYPLNRGPGHAANSVECYFYVYTLIGDPGLEMWTGVPQLLTVEHPSLVEVGSKEMAIRVRDSSHEPLHGAYVCLTGRGEILSGGFTGTDGSISLPICVEVDDSVTVTVTKHNFKPYQAIIPGEETPICLALLDHRTDDDVLGESWGDGDGTVNPGERIELTLAVRNAGVSATAFSVSASITTDDPYGGVIQGGGNFGDIGPGQSAWCNGAYAFSVSADCPDRHELSLSVEMSEAGGTTWTNRLTIPVEAPAFSPQTLSIDDADEALPNGQLDPGETVRVTVTLSNEGQKPAEGVVATLETIDPYIHLTDSRAEFGSLAVGEERDNGDDPFVVSADLRTFTGHQIHFALHVESNGGMIDTVPLVVMVGVSGGSGPIGPDAYGYLTYDNNDWRYYDRPTYSWMEIDPSRGGHGTDLNLVDEPEPDTVNYHWNYPQGDTEVLTLPFTFQYYGNTYDEISVCSNGWVSMGSTQMSSFRNWSIPAALGPPCLIAPFWDDLYMGDGCVASFYDEVGHRFIVEWSGVYNEYDDAVETFEVMLHDPAVYRTVTGDGEIVFQYHTVSNSDYAWNFATVGIESPDKRGGVEYTYAGQYAPGARELADGMAIKFTTGKHFAEGPFLTYYGCLIDDDGEGRSMGDGDGRVDAGERVEMVIRLLNYGEETAEGVVAILRSDDANVTIEDSSATFVDMAPADTVSSAGAFVVTVAPDCEDGHVVCFLIETRVSGVFCSHTGFEIEVVAPALLYECHSVSEVEGDGDARPESGETWELRVSAENVGGGQATGVWGVLTTEDETIRLLDASAAFSDVEAGGSCANGVSPFVFSVDAGASYHFAPFRLSLFANGNHYTTTLSFELVIERADILLVDDDGGGRVEVFFEAALDTGSHMYERYDRLAEGELDVLAIRDYETVIWFTGSERDSTLIPSDQECLRLFLDSGGRLFLTGQNIAADLRGSSFLRDYLHAHFVADSSGVIWLYGAPGDPITREFRLLSLATGDLGADNQDSPDEIELLEDAAPVLTYYGSGGAAALRYLDGHRVVYFAVGFESIIQFYDVANAYAMRAEMLSRILDWLHFEARIGDVNEDGAIDILDVVSIITMILDVESDPTHYQVWASDCNGDGLVNVVDVVGIANMILGTGSYAR